jgi:hypothetical protein
MHTIGHNAAGHRAGHDQAASQPAAATQHVVGMAQATLTAVVPFAEPGGCAGDGCIPMAVLAHGTGGGMSGWGLCVAVLSSFAVVVLLLALLLTGVTGRSRIRNPGGGVSRSPRGPPGKSFSLAVAAMSVLRI